MMWFFKTGGEAKTSQYLFPAKWGPCRPFQLPSGQCFIHGTWYANIEKQQIS